MARDYYAVLGVSQDASEEAIKAAYLARMRVVHPDKHGTKDTKAWATANELAAELNEAYEILRDVSKRAKYDSLINNKSKSSAPHAEARPSRAESNRSPVDAWTVFSAITPGKASWKDLPTTTLALLLRRQEDKEPTQVRQSLGGAAGNWGWIFLLLCWFGYLAFATGHPTWNQDYYYGYAAASIISSCLIGVNIASLHKYYSGPLRNNLFVTPLYLIETNSTEVLFWPLWTVQKASATHHHQNGQYRQTSMDLCFGEETRRWIFNSKSAFENFYERLALFDATARKQLTDGNAEYFIANDDFRGFSRETVTTERNRISAFVIPIALALLGLITFLAADKLNKSRAAERWYFHADGGSKSLAELWAGLTGSPNRPVSMTGQSPVSIIPPRGDTANSAARFDEDELTRRDGLEKLLPRTTPKASTPVPPQELPKNGAITRTDFTKEAIAPLRIVVNNEYNYYIKLVNLKSGLTEATVFVRAGMSVELEMPLGRYEFRHASGKTWYGSNFLFGEETDYRKADRILEFELVGNEVSGYTVELIRQVNGNLQEIPIKPEAF